LQPCDTRWFSNGWMVPAPWPPPTPLFDLILTGHCEACYCWQKNIVMRRRFYLLIAIGIFLAYSGLLEPYWIAERTHDISIRGLGPAQLTIVHISDIHTNRLGWRERRTVDRIDNLNPDYVLVSGDLLKARDNIAGGLDFLSKLRARYGVYFVPGNADDELGAAVRSNPSLGISSTYRILMNEHVDCGVFTLVGLDDPVTHCEDVEEAFRGVAPTKPVFVLTHFHPDSLLREFERRDVDLVFSGHTHGGQIGLVSIVDLVPYAHRSSYVGGLYALDDLYLNVTRGIGNNILPLRFLCRPEIVVLRLTGY
jgi:predicted MPP superfamily phosphohydrolase